MNRAHDLESCARSGGGGAIPKATSAAEPFRERLTDAAFRAIAAPILAAGGTWRAVAAAVGTTPGAARVRGYPLGLWSRVRGRPVGTPQSPEARARISEGHKRNKALDR
jgi:hypothetical protein